MTCAPEPHACGMSQVSTCTQWPGETWADGFGIWHASVPLTLQRHRNAAHARRLIMGEILARSPRGTTASDIALRVTLERITNHGTAIYREV